MKKMLCTALAAMVLLAACSGPVFFKIVKLVPHPVTGSTAEEEPEEIPPEAPGYEGATELPIEGAAGWPSVTITLYNEPWEEAGTLSDLPSGSPFRVLAEEGEWWRIDTGLAQGWVQHKYCLINLPDLAPSIVYDNANTYASLYISSGKRIPEITGEALYEGKTYNTRLGREEYTIPVLYSLAKKLAAAQRAALGEGNTLKVHEGYRPYETQLAVMQALQALADTDEEVMAGITGEPWSMNWFIATGVSNHQIGYAVDLTLARVDATEDSTAAGYRYARVTEYTEYEMPTRIHELSRASATFTRPVRALDRELWRDAVLSESMNWPALALQRYCTDAGLTPLASEWWHFNDLDALDALDGKVGVGGFIALLPE